MESYIINETPTCLGVMEMNSGVFRPLGWLMEKGHKKSKLTVKVDPNATYHEYMVVTGEEANVIFTSDDVSEYAEIRIIKDDLPASASPGTSLTYRFVTCKPRSEWALELESCLTAADPGELVSTIPSAEGASVSEGLLDGTTDTLERVMSTIEVLLREPCRVPVYDFHLYLLMFSQLQRSQRVFRDFPKLSGDCRIYGELFRVVRRMSTMIYHPGDIRLAPDDAKGEYFLENLLDLRWWTWVLALQAGMLLENRLPSSLQEYFGALEGVKVEAKSSCLPLNGAAISRRLPSYNFELWQQERNQGLSMKILLFESEDNRMPDQGENEAEMLLTEIRNVDFPCFLIKQLGPVKFQDDGKPSSIQDYLEIDLTQDLLGASSTGYVIRTTFSDGQGGSYFCALKRINIMDEKSPDLARLWHPHVVHLIHYWREKSGACDEVRGWMPKSNTFMIFLVMELMDGDLTKLMTSTKKAGVAPFSLSVAVDLMLQIAKGMLYLYEMGVSHPHLKCENILFRLANKTKAFKVGDVLVKLGGFGCSRKANVDTKKRDVHCFGLTCLEILTGDKWPENMYEADRVSRQRIPDTTPPILKQCIESCLDAELTFSEVVMLLLLAQLQIMQTGEPRMLSSKSLHSSLHIKHAQAKSPELASSSSSNSGLQEIFRVHQLHPQQIEVSTSVQITLIFFHGFPKVSEEWRMTWMTRDNMLVWPQKWLPEDLDGEIRVLSVTFDDHQNVNSNCIQREMGQNLLQRLVLSAAWKLGETEQAIVLVGHSFGGVIIKSLVIEAQRLARKAVQNSKDLEEVMKCTTFLKHLANVVFYSVPHAPTSTEFENYISGCSNTRVLQRSSLVKSLREDDCFIPDMIRLSRDFESAVPLKTKILAFLEGKPMSKKKFLVTEESCKWQSLSLEWHEVGKDNHFEVCRPESKSHIGYKILLQHLQPHMLPLNEGQGLQQYEAQQGAQQSHNQQQSNPAGLQKQGASGGQGGHAKGESGGEEEDSRSNALWKNGYSQGSNRRVNNRTSRAQREDSIRRTVYVSNIDQQREKDRERAAARAKAGAKGKDDGLTPEQRRERDAKALQEKLAKKAENARGARSAPKK
ncbi:hypothetical protein M758_4G238100 [Ceratodon purpureus]|nr:hypothetical protein M758_4G238100 [Ceratodon purpureus]